MILILSGALRLSNVADPLRVMAAGSAIFDLPGDFIQGDGGDSRQN
jgi:hypothetical protein